MNGRAIISMLDKTLYAVSNDESRYHLNGVYFETVEEKAKRLFRMVATDAHRLSLVDNVEALFDESAWRIFEQGVIIPKKGLNELRRLLSEGKDDFFAAIQGKNAAREAGKYFSHNASHRRKVCRLSPYHSQAGK
ncbi:MAG: hypothetical protein R3B54_17830 [Bdellovibrionota bacterium]